MTVIWPLVKSSYFSDSLGPSGLIGTEITKIRYIGVVLWSKIEKRPLNDRYLVVTKNVPIFRILCVHLDL